MKTIIGIDPGFSGGIACLRDSGLSAHAMPVLRVKGGKGQRSVLDLAAVVALLRAEKAHWACEVYIELVSSIPVAGRKQGAAGMFRFGETFGALRGIVAALELPVTFVQPQVWKRRLGVKANKDDARLRASELMPAAAHHWTQKNQDGLAEAALIALYGQQQAQGSIA